MTVRGWEVEVPWKNVLNGASTMRGSKLSTRRAETGLSLHLRAKNAPSVEANIPTGTVFEFIASVRKAAPTPFYQFLCHDAGMQF